MVECEMRKGLRKGEKRGGWEGWSIGMIWDSRAKIQALHDEHEGSTKGARRPRNEKKKECTSSVFLRVTKYDARGKSITRRKTLFLPCSPCLLRDLCVTKREHQLLNLVEEVFPQTLAAVLHFICPVAML